MAPGVRNSTHGFNLGSWNPPCAAGNGSGNPGTGRISSAMGRRCGRPESAHGRVNGVLYSNELLDAFPVHCLAWSVAPRRWQELGVACVSGNNSCGSPCRRTPSPRDPVSSEGAAAGVVVRASGRFSYRGLSGPQLNGGVKLRASCSRASTSRSIMGSRRHRAAWNIPGTLRAYRAHRVSGREVLVDPGEQDLTAQVDFAAVEAIGDSGRTPDAGAGTAAALAHAPVRSDVEG